MAKPSWVRSRWRSPPCRYFSLTGGSRPLGRTRASRPSGQPAAPSRAVRLSLWVRGHAERQSGSGCPSGDGAGGQVGFLRAAVGSCAMPRSLVLALTRSQQLSYLARAARGRAPRPRHSPVAAIERRPRPDRGTTTVRPRPLPHGARQVHRPTWFRRWPRGRTLFAWAPSPRPRLGRFRRLTGFGRRSGCRAKHNDATPKAGEYC